MGLNPLPPILNQLRLETNYEFMIWSPSFSIFLCLLTLLFSQCLVVGSCHKFRCVNGACAHYVMVSKFQWKPFWLATQRDPENDWTATQNRVNYDVFAQAPSAVSFCASCSYRCACLVITIGNTRSWHFDSTVTSTSFRDRYWLAFGATLKCQFPSRNPSSREILAGLCCFFFLVWSICQFFCLCQRNRKEFGKEPSRLNTTQHLPP